MKEVEEAEVEAEFWRIVDNVRDAIDKRTPPTEDVMVRPSVSINSSATCSRSRAHLHVNIGWIRRCRYLMRR